MAPSAHSRERGGWSRYPLFLGGGGGLFFLNLGRLFVRNEHVDVGGLDHEGVVAVEGKAVGFHHLLVVLVQLRHRFVELGFDFLFLGRVGLFVVGGVELDRGLTLGLHDLDIGLEFAIRLNGLERGDAHEFLLFFGGGSGRGGGFLGVSGDKTGAEQAGTEAENGDDGFFHRMGVVSEGIVPGGPDKGRTGLQTG